jgi:hypothetical protein
MKEGLKRVTVLILICAGFLWGSIQCDQIPRTLATPPRDMTNIVACFAWLKKPMGAQKLTDGPTTYFRILGPAGRFLASGPAGYAFDDHGRFVGWTADIGDFPTPNIPNSLSARWEFITVDEVRQRFH